MVSVETGGPHESSDGRDEMISESEIGAMIARLGFVDLVAWI